MRVPAVITVYGKRERNDPALSGVRNDRPDFYARYYLDTYLGSGLQ